MTRENNIEREVSDMPSWTPSGKRIEIPPFCLQTLAPSELEAELNKFRDFDLVAKIEFTGANAVWEADEAEVVIARHGAFACYGSVRYGISNQQQLEALNNAGFKYAVVQSWPT